MRNQLVSTNQLRLFKVVCLIPWVAILVSFALATKSSFQLNYLIQLGLFSYLFYIIYYKRIFRFRTIGFDDENLYIMEKGQEVIIPMVDVKYILLRSVLGTHSIKLYHDAGYGDEIFFKSSLWYPLNFKKVDDRVYLLKKRIETVKRNYTPESDNRLGS